MLDPQNVARSRLLGDVRHHRRVSRALCVGVARVRLETTETR